MNRQELIDRINAEEREAKTAGKIHRRDLMKHIRRMKRELRDYDRFQGGWLPLAEKEIMKSG